MHAPLQVNVQHRDQLIAPLRVRVAADGAQQLPHADVGAHDGVQDPFEPEVGHAREVLFEGVEAGDGDGVGGGEALAGEEAEEGGFAGAVGAYEEGAAGGGQVQGDVAQADGVVGEGEC